MSRKAKPGEAAKEKDSAQVGGYRRMSRKAKPGETAKESAQAGGYGRMSREAMIESKSDALMEAHMKKAVEQLRVSEGTAEEAAALWSVPVDPARGDEWYLEGTSSYTGPPARLEDVRPGGKRGGMRSTDPLENRIRDGRRGSGDRAEQEEGLFQKILHSRLYKIGIAAAAAIVCIWVLSYYQYFMRVDTTIFLDINPSMTMTVNRAGQVLKVEGNNADAEAALAGTDLKGKRTREAVEEILRVLHEQGYLTEQDPTMLLSVDGMNASRLMRTSGNLTAAASDFMEQEFSRGSVFSQRVQMTDEIREFAKSHSISAGKASLILQLVQDHPELDPEQLAALSMSELTNYLHSVNIDLRDYLEYTGEDLDAKWQKEDEVRKQEGPQDAALSEGKTGDTAGTREQTSGQMQEQQPEDADDDSDDDRDVDHDDDRDDPDDWDDHGDAYDRDDTDDADGADDSNDAYDDGISRGRNGTNDRDTAEDRNDRHSQDDDDDDQEDRGSESDNDTDDSDDDNDNDDDD